MNNNQRKQMGGVGGVFLVVGLVFLVLAITGKTVFLGVGSAFIALGVVFTGAARKGKDGDAAP